MQKCGTPTLREDLNLPITFQKDFYSDGVLCDVNILFNAMKVPHDEAMRNQFLSRKLVNSNHEIVTIRKRSRSSKLAEAMKTCLAEVLNSFSKEELKNYMVQLILNSCPLNDLNDIENTLAYVDGVGEGSNHPCESTTHNTRTNRHPHLATRCFPFANNQTNPECSNDSWQTRGRNSPSGCYRENSAGTNEEEVRRFFTGSDTPSTKAKEESNFNRIMRLLDTLCELRPLAGTRYNAKNTEASGEENSFPHNARRRLFHRQTSLADDEAVDCQSQTPHNQEWPAEEQVCGYGEWEEGVAPRGLTPFHTPMDNHQEEMYQPLPLTDTCCPSTTPSPCSPFARSNIGTVKHRRPKSSQRDPHTSTRRPHSPAEQSKSPPASHPRSRTQHHSLSTQPCPLVTPRMALNNPFLRLNKSLE